MEQRYEVPSDLHERLVAYSKRVNVTPSRVVRDLLNDYLTVMERKHAQPNLVVLAKIIN